MSDETDTLFVLRVQTHHRGHEFAVAGSITRVADVILQVLVGHSDDAEPDPIIAQMVHLTHQTVELRSTEMSEPTMMEAGRA